MKSSKYRLSVFGDEITSSLPEQIRAAADRGVRFLEVRTVDGVNISEMPTEAIADIHTALQREGMGVSAIASPVGKAAITGDFDVELERFRACADAADQLGTTLMRVFSYYIPDGRYAEYRDEVLRRMSTLAAEAAERGLTLVHENELYIYGDVPARALDVIESVGSPALQACFDPANFYQAGANPVAEGWELLAPYVRHFHVKDATVVDRTGVEPYPVRAPEGRIMSSVRPAGVGDAEVPVLLRNLLASGYDGFLTLEPHLRWYLPEKDGVECFNVAYDHLLAILDHVDDEVAAR